MSWNNMLSDHKLILTGFYLKTDLNLESSQWACLVNLNLMEAKLQSSPT